MGAFLFSHLYAWSVFLVFHLQSLKQWSCFFPSPPLLGWGGQVGARGVRKHISHSSGAGSAEGHLILPEGMEGEKQAGWATEGNGRFCSKRLVILVPRARVGRNLCACWFFWIFTLALFRRQSGVVAKAGSSVFWIQIPALQTYWLCIFGQVCETLWVSVYLIWEKG